LLAFNATGNFCDFCRYRMHCHIATKLVSESLPPHAIGIILGAINTVSQFHQGHN
jgi:hypothetical protein